MSILNKIWGNANESYLKALKKDPHYQALKAMEEQLTGEKNALDQQLKETQGQLKQVTEELNLTRDKVAALQKDNADLLVMQKELQNKMEVIALEKETLQSKFNSLEELKKAIRDLKERLHQERLAKRREQKDKQLSEGNRGYLIYHGVSTIKSKVKIEVIPVP